MEGEKLKNITHSFLKIVLPLSVVLGTFSVNALLLANISELLQKAFPP